MLQTRYQGAIVEDDKISWFDLCSEESWEASIFENHIAYPVLQEIRRELGYTR